MPGAPLIGTNPMSPSSGDKASSTLEGSAPQPSHRHPPNVPPQGSNSSLRALREEKRERASALPGPTLPPAHASTALLPGRDAGTHPGPARGDAEPSLHPAPQPEPLPVRWQQETAASVFPTEITP